MVKNKEIFFYLFILTGFFALLEISFFIQCNRVYLAEFRYIFASISIPITVLPEVIFFIFIQISIHLLFTLIVGSIVLVYIHFFNLSATFSVKLAISFWLLSILIILLANQYYFPNSRFSNLTSIIFFNETILKYCTLIFLFFYLLLIVSALGIFVWSRFEVVDNYPKLGFLNRVFAIMDANVPIYAGPWLSKFLFRLSSLTARQQAPMDKNILKVKFNWLILLVVIGIVFCCNLKFNVNFQKPVFTATKEHPNIFIIGIDSLRPDFLSFFGGEKQTYFIDSLLNNSVIFSEALTPIARTFPSWVSILTGEPPRKTGVRFNLASQNDINYAAMLSTLLRKQGYHTIFATDETRFSNIDEKFGFDNIIAPTMGLNDFLIGTFNDFPLSNLLVNLPLGRFFFPFSYANRAVYFTYQPDSFLDLIKSQLRNKNQREPFNKIIAGRKTGNIHPLFFAVHFCLPHFPYLWAGLPEKKLTVLQQYQASVIRVDKQIEDFFSFLKGQALLDHAIVVILSDHGEALEFQSDRITEKDLFLSSNRKAVVPRFYPPSLDSEEVNQSAGHGTDVLGLSQYHTLLAFKFYGMTNIPENNFSDTVTLMDIKPTILELLHLPQATPSNEYSGRSLAEYFKDAQHRQEVSKRHLLLESDFTPAAIRTIYPEIHQVVLENLNHFQVDPKTTRLVEKKTMGEMIIKSKQYADIYGEWQLALYPQNAHSRMPILINLRTGYWTNDLTTTFAMHSPALSMLKKMKSFYGEEID